MKLEIKKKNLWKEKQDQRFSTKWWKRENTRERNRKLVENSFQGHALKFVLFCRCRRHETEREKLSFLCLFLLILLTTNFFLHWNCWCYKQSFIPLQLFAFSSAKIRTVQKQQQQQQKLRSQKQQPHRVKCIENKQSISV